MTEKKTLKISADVDNLDSVTGFVDSHLEDVGCPLKFQMQIDVAVEEIFVNIASYAYEGKEGMAEIFFDIDSEKKAVITFVDGGVPYDPLKKADPDVTLSADERQIGGLGIFMVKKTMDDMIYEYKDEKNRLTLVKKLG